MRQLNRKSRVDIIWDFYIVTDRDTWPLYGVADMGASTTISQLSVASHVEWWTGGHSVVLGYGGRGCAHTG